MLRFNEIGTLSDDLKRDILGSRSDIIFTEGTDVSRDIALFGHLYPEFKILPKGGHAKVSEAVRALSGLKEKHWLNAYGIIDGDGRNEEEKSKLEADGLYALPFPAVENLFFLDSMVAAFVDADLLMNGGLSLSDRLGKLDLVVAATVIASRDEIIARRSVWLLDRELSSKKLSVKQIRADSAQVISVDVSILKHSVEQSFDLAVSSETNMALMRALPIKNTELPENAAKALGAKSFNQYCSVILRQMDLQTTAGKTAIQELKYILPHLPPHSL